MGRRNRRGDKAKNAVLIRETLSRLLDKTNDYYIFPIGSGPVRFRKISKYWNTATASEKVRVPITRKAKL